jgi:hypothetical protein
MGDRRGGRLWAGWLLGLMLGGLSFLTLCDLSFDCGCVAPGMGDWQHCDIMTAGPPDCPWCDRPTISAGTFVFAALGALLATRASVARLPFFVVVAASWAGFNLATLLAGIVTAIALGRPVLAGL